MVCDEIIKELYKILEKYGYDRGNCGSCYHIHSMINEIDDFLEASTTQHHVSYETFHATSGCEYTYIVIFFTDSNKKLDYIELWNDIT